MNPIQRSARDRRGSALKGDRFVATSGVGCGVDCSCRHRERPRGGLRPYRASKGARHAISAALLPADRDHVVVGTCHRGVLAVSCGWPDLRYVVGSGPDGADRALLAVLDECIEQRFDEVVIVSGDGIFAEVAARLGAHGVAVTVVAHRDSLSRRLEAAARHVRFLDQRFEAVAGASMGTVA